jgi:hypothetical protein
VTRAAQMVAIAAAFLLALVFAPVALGLGALWLLFRIVVYASATRGSAEIVGWTGEGSADDIERALAFPKLSFEGHDGATRVFISRMGYNIYDDPPPKGSLPIRYHLAPRFSAEIDDKAHWFTGPALTIAAALLGTFVAGVWRVVVQMVWGV